MTLAFSLVIAIGLVLIGRGLAVSLTGDDRANLPDTIESVEPFPEAVQVLSQTRVFVDLEAGYTGVLVIDGVELADDRHRRRRPTVRRPSRASRSTFRPPPSSSRATTP